MNKNYFSVRIEWAKGSDRAGTAITKFESEPLNLFGSL